MIMWLCVWEWERNERRKEKNEDDEEREKEWLVLFSACWTGSVEPTRSWTGPTCFDPFFPS